MRTNNKVLEELFDHIDKKKKEIFFLDG